MDGVSRLRRVRWRVLRAESSAFRAAVWEGVYVEAAFGDREIALDDGSIVRGYWLKRSIDWAIFVEFWCGR